jgi:hypothetical protein
MTRCARCSRPVLHPVHLAGLTLGRTCAQIIVGHVSRKQGKTEGAEQYVDPRQVDLFEAVPA